MKLFRTLIAAAAVLLFCAWTDLDYGSRKNWLICEADKTQTGFDLFYIYPTLYAGKAEYMPYEPAVLEKAVDFAAAQTGIFNGKCRVFAPFIRQREYRKVLDEYEKKQIDPRPGYDAVNALRYYLKHYNSGRPFILLGHSQGSANLYFALMELKEITAARGFVAAYLPGLQPLSVDTIKKDFAGRGIKAAAGAGDTGVVIVWNTQSPNVKTSRFAAKGAYCINPLNWRTDDRYAGKELNIRTVLYRFYLKDKNARFVKKSALCGAKIDLERGALIVDLPENGEYDARGALGKGVFHAVDIWLFAGNIAENAQLRVRNFLNGSSAVKD